MILNSPYISGSLTVTGNTTIQGQLTVTGSLSGTASLASNALLLQGTGSTGFATTASINEVSASQQSISASLLQVSASYIALSGSYNVFSASNSTILTSVSSSQQQISASLLNVIATGATTGSNSFRANQSITGSLVVTGQIVAQSINIQQVTSSIVYSSGSNLFGSALSNTQTFTGSVNITGSNHTIFGNVGIGTNPSFPLHIYSLNQNVASDLATAYSSAKFRLETYNTSGQGISMGSIGGYSQYIQAQYSSGTEWNPLLLQPFSGSVGIGVSTAPTVTLQVYSTGSSSSNITAEFWNGDYTTGARNFIRLRNAANVGATTSAYFGQGQDQKTYFYNNDFSRPGDIVITNTGKVGINRSDSNYNLDVSDNTGGTLNISHRNSSATTCKCSALLFSGYDTICGEKLSGAIVGESDTANYYGGHLKFLISGGNIYAACQLTEAMRITSAGNVGIAMTIPKTVLSVNAGTGAYPTLGTNVVNSFMVSRNDSLVGTYFGYAGDGNGWIQQMRNDASVAYNLILQPVGGSVGIGATNPRTQLDIGDIHDGIGGTTFCSFLVAQGVWATFACITDNDANVITDITYVNNNDSNRSGALLARWAYNGTCAGTYIVNCGWNWSQNINQFGIRNNGGALQICLGGGGNGYRVQARTQGARATG